MFHVNDTVLVDVFHPALKRLWNIALRINRPMPHMKTLHEIWNKTVYRGNFMIEKIVWRFSLGA